MYAGKSQVFDALCVHRDEVHDVPPGVEVLATSGSCDIQALSLREGERSFWGVQYHPEFDLFQISAMFKRSAKRHVERGLSRTEDEVRAFAEDLRVLHDDPSRKDLAWRYGITHDILDPDRHRREFANWLRVEVSPHLERRRTRRR